MPPGQCLWCSCPGVSSLLGPYRPAASAFPAAAADPLCPDLPLPERPATHRPFRPFVRMGVSTFSLRARLRRADKEQGPGSTAPLRRRGPPFAASSRGKALADPRPPPSPASGMTSGKVLGCSVSASAPPTWIGPLQPPGLWPGQGPPRRVARTRPPAAKVVCCWSREVADIRQRALNRLGQRPRRPRHQPTSTTRRFRVGSRNSSR